MPVQLQADLHGLLKVSVLIPGYLAKLLDYAELAARR